jgi:exonuclease SbcC
MKFHSIEIENITSLKGKHKIDFDELLNEESLMAITGPTGSGKSSILTSISLALFGKNYKTSLSSVDFVTLDQEKANIQLEFSVGVKRYKATWSCKVRKKNGDLIKNPKPIRNIFEADKALEITAEEIIGLNFDQFGKTVILNQGEFSRFLTSTFKDRKDILEKLYNGEQLSSLNEILKEKLKTILREKELLDSKIDNSLPFTEDEYKTYKEEHTKITEEFEGTKLLKDSSISHIKYIQDALEINTHYIKNSERSKDISKSLIDVTKDENDIKDKRDIFLNDYNIFHKSYEVKRKSIDKALFLLKDIEQLKVNIDKTNTIINKSKLSLKECDSYIHTNTQSIEKKSNLINNIKSELSFDSININTLKELFELAIEITHLNSSTKVHIENQKDKEQELENLTIKGTEQNNLLKDLNNDLLAIQKGYLDESKSYDDLQKHIFEKLEKLTLAKGSLESQKTTLKKLNDDIHADKEKSLILNGQLETLNTNNTNINLKIKKINLDHDLLLKKKELQKLESAIHICRQSLKEQDNCPACDTEVSTEKKIALLNSSFESIDIETEISLIHKDLIKQEKALEKSITDIKHTSDSLTSLNNLLKTNQEAKAKLEKSIELSSKDQKLTSIKNDLKRVEDLITNIKLINQQLSEDRNDYRKKSELLSKIKNQILDSENIINNKTNILKQSLDQDVEDINRLSEILKIEISNCENILNLERDLKQLSSETDLKTKEKLSISTQMENYCNELVSFNSQLNESNQELLKDFPNTNPHDELSILESNKNTFQLEKEKHDKSLLNISTKINQLNSQKGLLQEQSKELFNQMNNCFAKVQKSTIKQDTNQEVLAFTKKINLLENSQDFYSKTNEINTSLENVLIPYSKTILEKYDQDHAKSIKLKTMIDSFDVKKKSQKEDKSQLENITKELHRLQNLSLLLGKDEFRNFTLGLIEEQLIEQTNHELNSLCDGRYELEQVESSKGHEFYIVDHHKASLKRKIRTLSGGETFLVSLAMALSLAELTRGKAEIDSFFIDEGFGSLDEDAIEEALNILLSIRNRGKQIGVISHIKALTDRIPVNIHLEKSRHGESTISYLMN